MAQSQPRDYPYVWATWLPKLMLGDSTCQWSLWHMANFYYDKAPSDTDFTQWRVDHTRLVDQLATAEEQSGQKLSFEDQVAFRLRRDGGLIVHGKPDIVSRAGNEATVIEAKVGKVRDRDVLQTKIYMYAIPRCLPEYREVRLHGRVVYPDGYRIQIDSSAIDAQFEAGFNHWLELVERETPPRRVPSEDNCRFCKVSAKDCADRVGGAAALDDEW